MIHKIKTIKTTIENKSSKIDNINKIILCLNIILFSFIFYTQINQKKETKDVYSLIPAWEKNSESVIIYINQSYLDLILNKDKFYKYKIIDIIGTKGYGIVPNDIINTYLKSDSLVMITGNTMFFEEITSIGKGISIKTPVYKNNKIIGTKGIWIPDDKKLLIDEQ